MAVQVTRTGVVLTVGIVIVGTLLVGGLLFVQQSGEQARRNEAMRIAQQQLENNANHEVTVNNSSSDTPQQSVDQLPQTGSASVGDAFATIGIGFMTFALVSYLNSRRALLESN